MNISKKAEDIYACNKLSGSLSAWQIAEVKRMIRAGIRAGIRNAGKRGKSKPDQYNPRDLAILGGDPSL